MAQHCGSEKRLLLRILYCGPSSAGKSTNIEAIARTFGVAVPEGVGPFLLPDLDLDAPGLDTLAIEIGEATVGEAVVGKAEAPPTAGFIDNVDAVVFVVDVRKERLRANLIAWADLLARLRKVDRQIDDFALVLQWNKTDAESAVPSRDLETMLRVGGRPNFEAVSSVGRGVGKCFTEAVRRSAARAWIDLDLRPLVARDVFARAVDSAMLRLGARRASLPVSVQSKPQANQEPVSEGVPANTTEPTREVTIAETPEPESPLPTDALPVITPAAPADPRFRWLHQALHLERLRRASERLRTSPAESCFALDEIWQDALQTVASSLGALPLEVQWSKLPRVTGCAASLRVALRELFRATLSSYVGEEGVLEVQCGTGSRRPTLRFVGPFERKRDWEETLRGAAEILASQGGRCRESWRGERVEALIVAFAPYPAVTEFEHGSELRVELQPALSSTSVR